MTPEAHFATYPPDLIKPCIMAGTSAKGCCAKCGSPWGRVVERERISPAAPSGNSEIARWSRDDSGALGGRMTDAKTTGWQPTCKCNLQVHGRHPETAHASAGCAITPCSILDPFAGSGTTGAVALELGRKAILIELNPKYVELIKRRCDVTPGLALA